MSTTQTMTSRPNQGASSETAPVNASAFRGVPRAGSMLPNHAGSNRARPMLNRRRLLAMKKPLMPVKMAVTTATLRMATPAVPRLARTVAPVAQTDSPATSSRHGRTTPVASSTITYIPAPARIATAISRNALPAGNANSSAACGRVSKPT